MIGSAISYQHSTACETKIVVVPLRGTAVFANREYKFGNKIYYIRDKFKRYLETKCEGQARVKARGGGPKTFFHF